MSEDGFSEGEVLFAIVLEARRSPAEFTAETLRELLASVGYAETWDDAGKYLEFEAFQRDLKRKKA